MSFLSEDEVSRLAGPGVGPHPRPWPAGDDRLDPELLAGGDHRNVADRYRYWTMAAIVEDLNRTRNPLRIAIQNWAHDFNIGSMVRTANAFNVAGVHVIGRRRWNRRGAMVTDRYLSVEHHPDVASFATAMDSLGYAVVGVDNLPGAVALESCRLPEQVCLVFGSEGPGLTDELVSVCERLVAITQYGSTRSINAGAAAAIAMYHWARDWLPGPTAT
ncbi:TrmH family RNA methyltransferase [Microlunatus ginsengisoli]|uniref:rRNA methyltransferase n=1 Tax=Microlunatus ginsengisoli TaxID=363863 RepID=A0ABP7A4Z8_9ACTN